MKLPLLLLCLLSSASAKDERPVVTVEEGADALLPCALSSGRSVDKFDWKKDSEGEVKKEVFLYDKGLFYGNGRSEQDQSPQFRGRIEFFKERLESGNASIKIKHTDLKDNGTYTCVLFKPEKHEVNIRLNVGAAPEPSIKVLQDESTWRLLLCKVQGVPKPQVEWKNSSGGVLKIAENYTNQNGRYYVELELNVTRSDIYTCVATQQDIYHQIHDTTKVSLAGGTQDKEYHIILVAAAVIVLVAIVSFGLGCFLQRCLKGQTAIPPDNPDNFIKGDSQ